MLTTTLNRTGTNPPSGPAKANISPAKGSMNPINHPNRIPIPGQKRKRSSGVPAAPQLDCPKSPAELVPELFLENGFDVVGNPSLVRVPFVKTTEEMINAYKLETLQAARSENLSELRRLHQNGTSLSCCNRFGESLMHLVCRRGSTAIVKFLLEEANVPLFLRDDYGRTPLHDACWTSKPNFELFLLIIRKCPELLCMKDVRGHTPLNYVRRGDWDQWRNFLMEHRALFRPRNVAPPPPSATAAAHLKVEENVEGSLVKKAKYVVG